MPNHIKTIVECDNLEALWKLRDFNILVPRPITLEKARSGSLSSKFEALYQEGIELEAIIKQLVAENKREEPNWIKRQCQRYAFNLKRYGYVDWYDWSYDYWGTKWSACDYELLTETNQCLFWTANCHAYPVIETLSKLYPNELFIVQYADEDIGCNADEYSIKNGSYLFEGHYENGSKEAFELAFELWGKDEEFVFNEVLNTYECQFSDED